MAAPIGGPGIPLPLPTNLYPTELFNAAYDFSNGVIALMPGACLQVPPGVYSITLGTTLFLQWIDPANNVWRNINLTAGGGGGCTRIKSDGSNYRVVNLNGVPYAGTVSAGGSGYSQSGVTISPSSGNSVWQPIIGGALAVSTINRAGAGFTIPPLVILPGPPAAANCFDSPQNMPIPVTTGYGGVQAAAYTVLTSNTVSAVSMVPGSVGAGYTGSVVGLLLPSPFDPNFGSITPGTVTFTTTSAGVLTAAICLNGGISVTSTMALTVAGGGGTGGSVTPVFGTTSTVTYDTCFIQPAN